MLKETVHLPIALPYIIILHLHFYYRYFSPHLLTILLGSQSPCCVAMSQIIEPESKYLRLSSIYHIGYPFYKYYNYLIVARRDNWTYFCGTCRYHGKNESSFLRGCRSSASIE
jgi:hypothetical protein